MLKTSVIYHSWQVESHGIKHLRMLASATVPPSAAWKKFSLIATLLLLHQRPTLEQDRGLMKDKSHHVLHISSVYSCLQVVTVFIRV